MIRDGRSFGATLGAPPARVSPGKEKDRVQSPSRPAVPSTPLEARRSHLESAGWRRALIWGLRNVPLPLQELTLPLWAAFFYAQVPEVRRALELNLRRLTGARPPSLELAAFRTFLNYCRCIANAYRVHAGAPLALPARTAGLEHLERALADGGGAILATAHLGNWHLGPYYLAERALPPITVVMSEEPDRGAQQIDAGLRDDRMRVLYSGDSPLLGLELRARLRRGELVGLQMDRPGAGNGVRVRCGAHGTARFASGPAQLAWSSGAPVLPVFFPLEGGALSIRIEPPLRSGEGEQREAAVARITAELAAIYAREIERYPEQWFNFFDFFGGEDAVRATEAA
jgi:KDO2-lipid IV(A) lauroyltransferase